MKKVKCELWIGTHTNFFKWGTFESIAAAKKYISDCRLTCYREIKRLTPKKQRNEKFKTLDTA